MPISLRLFIYSAYGELPCSLVVPFEMLPTLDPSSRRLVLADVLPCYAAAPSPDLASIAHLCFWRSLQSWARIYPQTLPSEILELMTQGVAKGKRYLGLYTASLLARRARSAKATAEAEAILAGWFADVYAYQRPSDSGERERLLRALSSLTPLQRSTLYLLSQGNQRQEIATLQGVTSVNAMNRIANARQALRRALQRDN